MPVIVRLRFPWGRYHATSWGRHVNEGAVDWPPAPWRLLRAFYATWRNRTPELPEDTVHALLSVLASAPPDYVAPRHRIAHTRHYMPDGRAAYASFDEGRDMTFDTFASVERDAAVHVHWPVDLPPVHHDALVTIVSRIPYVGRAESVCEASVVPSLPDTTSIRVRPVESGASDGGRLISLLSPESPLDFDALLRRGHPDPANTRWVRYEVVEAAPEQRRREAPAGVARPTAVRWTYTAQAQPSVTATVAMGHVLRRVCQSKFGEHCGGASPTLSGRAADGPRRSDSHSHAHYLALSSDGRFVDSLIAWSPEGFGPDEIRALGTLTALGGHGHIPDFRPGRVGLVALGQVEHVAPELVGPATEWRSGTPFAPARHLKRHSTWEQHVVDQVRFELANRGLPEPSTVEVVPGRWLDYRRHRPDHQRLAEAHRATGVHITFPEPLSGPLSLGALNHFGLGLFMPYDQTGAADREC